MSEVQILLLLLLSGYLVSMFLGMMIIPRVLAISHKKRLCDVPDSRKVHTTPAPRLGGLSLFPVVLMSFALVIGFRLYLWPLDLSSFSIEMLHKYFFLFVGMALLYLVGVCDDLVGVGYRYKFIVQVVSALLLVLSGNWLDTLGGLFRIYSVPALLGVPVTVFAVVYVTNAINLIDGIDGLASGLCCIALSVLSVFFFIQDQCVYTLLAICTLGILMPFWYYNVFGNANCGHKLFMSDAGSLALGYVISFPIIHLCVLNSTSTERSNSYLVIAFSTVLVSLLDVVHVVLRCLRKHKNPFLPDKNHFHHKLLRTGIRVRMVMVTIICMSVFLIVLNIVLTNHLNVNCILFLNLFLWTVLHLVIDWLTVRNRQKRESAFDKRFQTKRAGEGNSILPISRNTTKKVLKGWLIDNAMTTDNKTDKISLLASTGNLTLDDVLEEMYKQDTGLRLETMRCSVTLYHQIVMDLILNDYSVDTGLFRAIPQLKGVIEGGAWNKENNSICVSFTQDKVLCEAIVKTVVEILGEKSNIMYILEAEDRKTGLEDGSATAGHNFFVCGAMLKVVGDHESVDVTLTDSKGATTKLTDGQITINNPSPLTLLLPADLAEGEYTLTVTTQYGSAGHILETPRSVSTQIWVDGKPADGGGDSEGPDEI